MTDVTVVIPTRDRPELLALTLRSALNQQRVNIEVLVVNDGVGYETTALIESLGDPRIRVVRNAGRAGMGGARNSGIAAAASDWIAFLDDDDLWAPTKLAAQLAVGEESGAGWVYAGDVTVDEELRVRAGSPPPSPRAVVDDLVRHNTVPAGASNVMVRRDILDVAGRFDPELQISADWDMWLRLARTSPPACVPRPLVALRTHRQQASRRVDGMLAEVQMIARRHGVPFDLARHERWAAWMCLEDGRRREALRHYVRAVAHGDVLSLGRAMVSLAYPEVARRRRPLPATGWTTEAQAWLDALRVQAAGLGFKGL